MNDQERDPVGWAQMQNAGRVGGIAAANDREDSALDHALEDEIDRLVDGMAHANDLARAIYEREHGPW